MNEVNLYIGCKIINAKPMSAVAFINQVKLKEDKPKDLEDKPGYIVEYPDGYTSWSPKEVFETAYRRVDFKEFQLIKENFLIEGE